LFRDSQKRSREASPTGFEVPDQAPLVVALVEHPETERRPCLEALAASLRTLPLAKRADYLAVRGNEAAFRQMLENEAKEFKKLAGVKVEGPAYICRIEMSGLNHGIVLVELLVPKSPVIISATMDDPLDPGLPTLKFQQRMTVKGIREAPTSVNFGTTLSLRKCTITPAK
jgi:hypothetical protein